MELTSTSEASLKNWHLSIAVRAGKFKCVDSQDHLGWTPLHWSVWTDNVDMIRFILERGAKAKLSDMFGQTPLALSLWSCPDILSFFVSRGDFNERNEHGWSDTILTIHRKFNIFHNLSISNDYRELTCGFVL